MFQIDSELKITLRAPGALDVLKVAARLALTLQPGAPGAACGGNAMIILGLQVKELW